MGGDAAGGAGMLLLLGGVGMLSAGGTLLAVEGGPAVITGFAGLRGRAKFSGTSYGDL